MSISKRNLFKALIGTGLAALLPKAEAVEARPAPWPKTRLTQELIDDAVLPPMRPGDEIRWRGIMSIDRVPPTPPIHVNADHPNAGTSATHGYSWDMPLTTLQDAIDRAATITDAVILVGPVNQG